MKRFRTILCVLLVALMAFVGAACGGDNKTTGSRGTDNIVKIYLWNDTGATPAGFADTLKYFNDTYSKELGFTVQFSFDLQDDYKSKLNLAMAAGQTDYDMVFDANWIYLNNFSKKGYYWELSDYFKEGSGYDGLVNCFSQEYLDSNKFNGGVYGIPLTETYGEISVAYVRKDWREACAADTTFVLPATVLLDDTTKKPKNTDLADGIGTFDEMQYYLYWVKANKPGVVPCLSNSDATWGAWDLINARKLPEHSAQEYVNNGIKQEIILTSDVTATAYINRGEVRGVYLSDLEDPNEALQSFPAGFNSASTEWQSNFDLARRWAEDGIIGKDVLSTTDSDAQFKAGMGGCVVQTISNFAQVESALSAATNGEGKLEIFVNNYVIREKLPGYAQTDYKAWNYLCIPKSTSPEKRDQCMKFLNWIFESREHHDLFEYGIKGTHWEEAKDESGEVIPDTYSTVGMQSYAFPAYELTWNANYIRVNNASDPKVREYMQYMYDPDRYVRILYSEFTFDHTRTNALTTAFANAKIGEVRAEATSYYLGQVDDPVTHWNSVLQARYDNSALQESVAVIKEAVKTQLQAYIDSLS